MFIFTLIVKKLRLNLLAKKTFVFEGCINGLFHWAFKFYRYNFTKVIFSRHLSTFQKNNIPLCLCVCLFVVFNKIQTKIFFDFFLKFAYALFHLFISLSLSLSLSHSLLTISLSLSFILSLPPSLSLYAEDERLIWHFHNIAITFFQESNRLDKMKKNWLDSFIEKNTKKDWDFALNLNKN